MAEQGGANRIREASQLSRLQFQLVRLSFHRPPFRQARSCGAGRCNSQASTANIRMVSKLHKMFVKGGVHTLFVRKCERFASSLDEKSEEPQRGGMFIECEVLVSVSNPGGVECVPEAIAHLQGFHRPVAGAVLEKRRKGRATKHSTPPGLKTRTNSFRPINIPPLRS